MTEESVPSAPRKRAKTRIRAVTPADFAAICALMRKELTDAFSDAQWMRIFDHNWSAPPHYGHLMETDDGRVVGFIGAIVAQRPIDGELRTVCNLTSWCVDEHYRGEGGLMLLMPYLRKNDWIVTTLTPAPVVVELFDKMGFKYYDHERLVLPAFWNLGFDFAPLHVTAKDALRAKLTADEARMLADHEPHGCRGYLFEAGGRRLFLITKTLAKRGIPFSEILHCSDPAFLGRRLERIKLAVMRRDGTLGVMCDGRFVGGRPRAIRLRRVAMLRARNHDGHSLDNLYTERVLLPV